MRWRIYHRLGLRVGEQHLDNLDTIIHPASYDYRPKPLIGSALFFQSSDWPSGPYWDFYASWKEMIADLRVCKVKGGHESMFAENNVAPIVAGIRDGLAQVRAAESVVA
jgi:thioesterase domain-containing protein